MLKEFREFAMKGNVLDMAVGIILGGAFTPIVKSLVDELLMPLVGLMIGKVDFSSLYLLLRPGAADPGPYETLAAAKDAGAVVLGYGAFINTIVTFLIVSFALFILIKGMNKLRRETPAAPEAPSTKVCPKCCTDINVKAVRCPACTSELTA